MTNQTKLNSITLNGTDTQSITFDEDKLIFAERGAVCVIFGKLTKAKLRAALTNKDHFTLNSEKLLVPSGTTINICAGGVMAVFSYMSSTISCGTPKNAIAVKMGQYEVYRTNDFKWKPYPIAIDPPDAQYKSIKYYAVDTPGYAPIGVDEDTGIMSVYAYNPNTQTRDLPPTGPEVWDLQETSNGMSSAKVRVVVTNYDGTTVEDTGGIYAGTLCYDPYPDTTLSVGDTGILKSNVLVQPQNSKPYNTEIINSLRYVRNSQTDGTVLQIDSSNSGSIGLNYQGLKAGTNTVGYVLFGKYGQSGDPLSGTLYLRTDYKDFNSTLHKTTFTVNAPTPKVVVTVEDSTGTATEGVTYHPEFTFVGDTVDTSSSDFTITRTSEPVLTRTSTSTVVNFTGTVSANGMDVDFGTFPLPGTYALTYTVAMTWKGTKITRSDGKDGDINVTVNIEEAPPKVYTCDDVTGSFNAKGDGTDAPYVPTFVFSSHDIDITSDKFSCGQSPDKVVLKDSTGALAYFNGTIERKTGAVKLGIMPDGTYTMTYTYYMTWNGNSIYSTTTPTNIKIPATITFTVKE